MEVVVVGAAYGELGVSALKMTNKILNLVSRLGNTRSRARARGAMLYCGKFYIHAGKTFFTHQNELQLKLSLQIRLKC